MSDSLAVRLAVTPGVLHCYSNIIKRALRRLVIRNKTNDLHFHLVGPPLPDMFNLIGDPLSDIPHSCIYNLFQSGNFWWFDVRDLAMMFSKGNYKNPYTNLPFSRYQRYLVLRKYYQAIQQPGYQTLHMGYEEGVSYQAYILSVDQLFNQPFIANYHVDKLQMLISQLNIWYPDTKRYTMLLNRIQYYYSQGNHLLYRYHVAKLLHLLYDQCNDSYMFTNMIELRLSRCGIMDPCAYQPLQSTWQVFIPLYREGNVDDFILDYFDELLAPADQQHEQSDHL